MNWADHTHWRNRYMPAAIFAVFAIWFWFALACLIIVAVMLFVGPAKAQLVGAHHPPPHYDYPTDMDIRVMPLGEVQRKCAILAHHNGDRSLIQGCALPYLSPCVVLLPPNAPDWVFKHERAHCNGWRH